MISKIFNRICIVVLFCVSIQINAQSIIQSEDLRTSLDSLFGDLDFSKVSTGLLWDYSLNLVDSDMYDGSELSDNNYVSPMVWENMLYTVKSASLNADPIGNVSDIMARLRDDSDGYFPLGFIAYNYNYIKPNALNDNLITFFDNKISDKYINGVWQNPYDEAILLGFTPGKMACEVGTISFMLLPELLFTNLQINNIVFDADDGLGFRTITPNTPIVVNYSSGGLKELRLLLNLNNGQQILSHSAFLVKDILHKVASQTRTPDNTQIIQCSETYSGKTVSAQITTYYRNGYNSYSKPFIVVEGFDPWRLLEHLSELSNELNGLLPGLGEYHNGKFGSTWHGSFIDKWTLASDYDLIYIDLFDSTEDIRDNACLLEKVIKRINNDKFLSGCSEPNILMGQSMGGLISRLSLLNMEADGYNHDVSYFISHDSPHLGANLPLGFLFLAQHLFSFLLGDNFWVNLLENKLLHQQFGYYLAPFIDVLFSPAVRQMLVNFVDEDGSLNNQTYESFYQMMDSLGFPKGSDELPIQNIAIVNGGVNSQTDIFNAMGGQRYMYLDGYGRLLGSFVNVYAVVYPFMQNYGMLSELQISYLKKIFGTTILQRNIYSATSNAPRWGIRYDGVSGSVFYLEDVSAEFDKWLYGYEITPKIADRILFIPSASALCMNVRTSINYARDYSKNPPIPENETPFEAYYIADRQKKHIEIDSTVLGWVEKQIDMRIVGPDRIDNSSRFRLENSSGIFKWTVSDTTIATIGTYTGILNPVGNGVVKITAERYVGGQLYRKTKDVLVGLPDMFIDTSFIPGTGYRFTIRAVEEEYQDVMDEILSSSGYSYEWTILDLYGNRETFISQSKIYEFLPDMDKQVTIAVRLVDGDGSKGPLYSTTLDLECPFYVRYKYVAVDSNADVYWVMQGDGHIPYPQWDYGVQYMFPIYNPSDNANSAATYLKGGSCYISYPAGTQRHYFTGIRDGANYAWTFDLWNSDYFLDRLELAVSNAESGIAEPGDIIDFDMILCNSMREPLQRLTMAIVHVEY